jgi:predicted transcriptional regulator
MSDKKRVGTMSRKEIHNDRMGLVIEVLVEHKELSPSELMSTTGLDYPKLMKITRELKEEGTVEEYFGVYRLVQSFREKLEDDVLLITGHPV